MLLVFLPILFLLTFILFTCMTRDVPPLYTERMAAHRNRFRKNDKMAELYKKMLEAKAKERAEWEALRAGKNIDEKPTAVKKDKVTKIFKILEKEKLLSSDWSDSNTDSKLTKETQKTSEPSKAQSQHPSEPEKKTEMKKTESKYQKPIKLEPRISESQIGGLDKTQATLEENSKKKVKDGDKKLKSQLKTKIVNPKDENKTTLSKLVEKKTLVTADKTKLSFLPAGGTQTVKLANKGEVRLVIKTRCSDNQIFVVIPVFTTVEIGQTVEVKIRRLPGAAKVDKVVFEWLPLENKEKDLAAIFRKKDAGQNKLELQVITK